MDHTYKLVQGGLDLGVLVPYEYDFPWVYCNFIAATAFTQLKDFFDEDLKIVEEEEDFQGDMSNTYRGDEGYDNFQSLGLYLLRDDGVIETSFLLHIDDHEKKAWFRT